MADLKVHEVWKYVVQHKKKDEIDEETFLKWYQEELMPECVRLLKKHNIPRFSVYYTPSSLRKPRQEELEKANNPNWQVPEWDVTTTYLLSHPDDVEKFHGDPEWTSRVGVPATQWIADSIHISFGYETIYLDEGKVMNTVAAMD